MRRATARHTTARLVNLDQGDPLNRGLVFWAPGNEGTGERQLNARHKGAGRIVPGDNLQDGIHARPIWYGYGEHWTAAGTVGGAFGGRSTVYPSFGEFIVPAAFSNVQRFSFAYRASIPSNENVFGPVNNGSWLGGWGSVIWGANVLFWLSNYSVNPRVVINAPAARRGWMNVVGSYDQSTMRLWVNGSEGEHVAGAVVVPFNANCVIPRGAMDCRIWHRPLTRAEALRYINDGPNAGGLWSPSRRFALINGAPAANDLAASAEASATTTAGLSTTITLAASAEASATTTAGLSTTITLAASAEASATTTAGLSTTITLAAAATAAATTTAEMAETAAALEGAATAEGSTAAGLTTAILLAGSSSATAEASATLGGFADLAADASGTATATAALSTAIALLGDAAATATVSADLGGAADLAADATASATSSADLATGIALAVDATATANSSATLDAAAGLAAEAVASAAASAQLTATIRLVVHAFTVATAAGDLIVGATIPAASRIARSRGGDRYPRSRGGRRTGVSA